MVFVSHMVDFVGSVLLLPFSFFFQNGLRHKFLCSISRSVCEWTCSGAQSIGTILLVCIFCDSCFQCYQEDVYFEIKNMLFGNFLVVFSYVWPSKKMFSFVWKWSISRLQDQILIDCDRLDRPDCPIQ